jgi:hypothetical protein
MKSASGRRRAFGGGTRQRGGEGPGERAGPGQGQARPGPGVGGGRKVEGVEAKEKRTRDPDRRSPAGAGYGHRPQRHRNRRASSGRGPGAEPQRQSDHQADTRRRRQGHQPPGTKDQTTPERPPGTTRTRTRPRQSGRAETTATQRKDGHGAAGRAPPGAAPNEQGQRGPNHQKKPGTSRARQAAQAARPRPAAANAATAESHQAGQGGATSRRPAAASQQSRDSKNERREDTTHLRRRETAGRGSPPRTEPAGAGERKGAHGRLRRPERRPRSPPPLRGAKPAARRDGRRRWRRQRTRRPRDRAKGPATEGSRPARPWGFRRLIQWLSRGGAPPPSSAQIRVRGESARFPGPITGARRGNPDRLNSRRFECREPGPGMRTPFRTHHGQAAAQAATPRPGEGGRNSGGVRATPGEAVSGTVKDSSNAPSWLDRVAAIDEAVQPSKHSEQQRRILTLSDASADVDSELPSRSQTAATERFT